MLLTNEQLSIRRRVIGSLPSALIGLIDPRHV